MGLFEWCKDCKYEIKGGCVNTLHCVEGNKYLKENKEMVNHPKHYNTGKFEVIEVIEDWNLNFNLGNAVKYISRCEHKGNKKQDLEKAVWYLQRELDKLK